MNSFLRNVRKLGPRPNHRFRPVVDAMEVLEVRNLLSGAGFHPPAGDHVRIVSIDSHRPTAAQIASFDHLVSEMSRDRLTGLRDGAHPDADPTGHGGVAMSYSIYSYLPYPVEELTSATKIGNSAYYSSFSILGYANSQDRGFFGYTSRPLGNGQTEYYYYVTCYNAYGNETVEATSSSPYYTYQPQLVGLYHDNRFYTP
jgi:hypothetical protein